MEENLRFFDILPQSTCEKELFNTQASVFSAKREELLTPKGQKSRSIFRKVILLAVINAGVHKFAFSCY